MQEIIRREYNVKLVPDSKGYIGRVCPSCHKYFKVKFGTGLPTKEYHCPYCGNQATYGVSITSDQLRYGQSVAVERVAREAVNEVKTELGRLLGRMNRELSRSPLRINFKLQHQPAPSRVRKYVELELETHSTCDSCGLEFAIYGVFARCPDCAEMNVMNVFRSSLVISRRWLERAKTEVDAELQKGYLKNVLSEGVSAFDGLGKGLRRFLPGMIPDKPVNLLQNLPALSNALLAKTGRTLEDIVGVADISYLVRMFNVRHIYEHNMGVIDESFVARVPDLANLVGRIYPLTNDEIARFPDAITEAAEKLVDVLNPSPSGEAVV